MTYTSRFFFAVTFRGLVCLFITVAGFYLVILAGSLTGGDKFLKVITYLKNHKEYMKYNQYLSKGYPIGSGVVESACSHVVKERGRNNFPK